MLTVLSAVVALRLVDPLGLLVGLTGMVVGGVVMAVLKKKAVTREHRG